MRKKVLCFQSNKHLQISLNTDKCHIKFYMKSKIWGIKYCLSYCLFLFVMHAIISLHQKYMHHYVIPNLGNRAMVLSATFNNTIFQFYRGCYQLKLNM